MAPPNSHEAHRYQRGRFNGQRPDGRVIVGVFYGSDLVLSGASIASTGMGRLLAIGLVQNEPLYYTTRECIDGQEIDQVFCDRIDGPQPRFEGIISKVMYRADQDSPMPRNPIYQTDHGVRNAHRMSAYHEPHPFSLQRVRDMESIRYQSLSNSPIDYGSYARRGSLSNSPIHYGSYARRGSLRHEQSPLFNDLEPSQNTLSRYDSPPPPYSRGENPPPYTIISHRRDETNAVVLARLRSGNDAHGRGGQRFTLSQLYW